MKDYDKKYNYIVKTIYSLDKVFTLEELKNKVDFNLVSKEEVLDVLKNLKDIGILEEALFTYRRIK